MKESLTTALTQLYQDVMALIDIVQGQLSLLVQTTGVPPELEQGFAARQEHVAAVLKNWQRIADSLHGESASEELNGEVQKVQLAVRLFLELDKKLVEQLNERTKTVLDALGETQRLVRGLTLYSDSARMADGVTELLRRNPSRWMDTRT